MTLPTLAQLAETMQKEVHRFDGEFPYDTTLETDGGIEVLKVSITDFEGNHSTVYVDKVERYDDIHQRYIVESGGGFHYYLQFFKPYNPFG
jgi:hypothetical protein